MAWSDTTRKRWFGNPLVDQENDWAREKYEAYFGTENPNTIAWVAALGDKKRLSIRKALFLAATWMPNAVHIVRDDTRAIVIEPQPRGREVNWQSNNKIVICCRDAIELEGQGIGQGDQDDLFLGLLPDNANTAPKRRLKTKDGTLLPEKCCLEFHPIESLLNLEQPNDFEKRIRKIDSANDVFSGDSQRLIPAGNPKKSRRPSPKTNHHDHDLNMQVNTILYGPPGTGKTLATLGLALSLFTTREKDPEIIEFASLALQEKYAPPPDNDWADWVEVYDQFVNEGRIAFTTFHQNYAYEDFVEGLRAETRADQENGPTSVSYSVQDGIFKRMAYRALYAWLTGEPCPTAPEDEQRAFAQVRDYLERGQFPSGEQAKPNDDNAPPYLLIIDEINRGNMARILGELITLLEDSKRARRTPALGQQPLKAILPYTRLPFIVPPNLYILGTMNTADRSLIGLDVALRRRFSFVELPPRAEALPDMVEGVNLRAFFEEINRRIAGVLDSDHLIGHAFFVGVTTLQGLGNAMRQKVIPQLREYFHDRPQDLFEVLKKSDGNTCDFLIFEGDGRNRRFKGINTDKLYIADTYSNLLPNGQAANAADQGV